MQKQPEVVWCFTQTASLISHALFPNSRSCAPKPGQTDGGRIRGRGGQSLQDLLHVRLSAFLVFLQPGPSWGKPQGTELGPRAKLAGQEVGKASALAPENYLKHRQPGGCLCTQMDLTPGVFLEEFRQEPPRASYSVHGTLGAA